MSDIQQEAEVQQEGYGSLERGIAGQFEFSVSNIINEAWERTKGNKGTLWLAIIIYAVISLVVSFVSNHLIGFIGFPAPSVPSFSPAFFIPSFLANLIGLLVLGPIGIGLFMLSLKIVSGESREPTDIFNYFSHTVKIFLTYLAMYALIVVGLCLFILPGIYLAVAYSFALPLVVEKNLTTWQALEASRKAITHIWFSFFGMGIIMAILAFLAAILLLVGLIWAIPFMMLAYAIAYRIIFGRETAVTVEA